MSTIDETKRDAFLGQVFGDLSAAYGAVMVSLGDRLGIYAALDGAGPLTSAQVAERAGCAERYVREWLNSQVAAGYLEYDPQGSTYVLPPEHAAVLADRESPILMTPAFNVPAAMWHGEDLAVQAFRTGEGVPWGAHQERLFCGVGAFYRNAYGASLVPEWLPALDGVVERLEAGAKVADVGCGHGASTIIMAQAFPKSQFVGIDFHGPSITHAKEHAKQLPNVRFETARAQDFAGKDFDLVTMFDALHDMGDPTGATAHARKALKSDGTLMLVEPMAGNSLAENLNPVGRVFYAFSTAVCVPASLNQEVGTALGAQAGEMRLSEVVRQGGFSRVRRATETPFNMVLEARP